MIRVMAGEWLVQRVAISSALGHSRWVGSRVLATLYRILGIDPAMTFMDYNGRPQYVLEDRVPVHGLL